MGLFARKLEAAPPAPAKRKDVTRSALEAAIAACSAGLAADCTTMRTLDKLSDLVGAGDGLVRLDGPAPVTLAELDEVIAENVELPASTLSTLKRVRAMLAAAEEKVLARVGEPAQYVTVAQLKAHDAALFDAFGWALGATFAELNRGQPSQAHVLDILGRSASSPERKKLLSGIREFREADVPPRTQAEFLRYQVSGKW